MCVFAHTTRAPLPATPLPPGSPPPPSQAVRRAETWSEVLAEAKKSADFQHLKLNDAVLSMADRTGLSAGDKRDERMFDDEMLDMHEMIDGNYQPSNAADRGDIRRKSTLPGSDSSSEVMPQAEKKALPTVFGSVREARSPRSAFSPLTTRAAPCWRRAILRCAAQHRPLPCRAAPTPACAGHGKRAVERDGEGDAQRRYAQRVGVALHCLRSALRPVCVALLRCARAHREERAHGAGRCQQIARGSQHAAESSSAGRSEWLNKAQLLKTTSTTAFHFQQSQVACGPWLIGAAAACQCHVCASASRVASVYRQPNPYSRQ